MGPTPPERAADLQDLVVRNDAQTSRSNALLRREAELGAILESTAQEWSMKPNCARMKLLEARQMSRVAMEAEC